jgi:hypothetical protein
MVADFSCGVECGAGSEDEGAVVSLVDGDEGTGRGEVLSAPGGGEDEGGAVSWVEDFLDCGASDICHLLVSLPVVSVILPLDR